MVMGRGSVFLSRLGLVEVLGSVSDLGTSEFALCVGVGVYVCVCVCGWVGLSPVQ